MRLLLLVLISACAPKAAPVAQPTTQGLASQSFVVEPWGALPSAAPAPAARSHAASPALAGERMALDLKSLARTQLDYTLHMETAELGRADEHDERLLLAHLAADPRWRVGQVDGVLAAVRRAEAPGGWVSTPSGYHDHGEGPWRVLVRFGAWDATHPWRTSDFVGRARADQDSAQIRGFLPPNTIYEGRVTTALSIDGDRLGVDIYEMGPADDRAHTRWALGELPSLLHNVRVMRKNLGSIGHERMLLPRGEPAVGPAAVQVERSATGELEFRARVNPGAPGWVWLRLVTPQGTFDEAPVAEATRERIGWSPSPSDVFFAQARFQVDPGPAFPATAEIWFQPDHGAARAIHSERIVVPAR